MAHLAVDDDLLSRVREAAVAEGFDSVEDYVAALMAQGVARARRRSFRDATRRVRAAMQTAGLTEDQVLADFEQFRDELWRERVARGELPWATMR